VSLANSYVQLKFKYRQLFSLEFCGQLKKRRENNKKRPLSPFTPSLWYYQSPAIALASCIIFDDRSAVAETLADPHTPSRPSHPLSSYWTTLPPYTCELSSLVYHGWSYVAWVDWYETDKGAVDT
jgi:hypothetical protein